MAKLWYRKINIEWHGTPAKKRRYNMALTRKFLKALGIEDDKIEQIIEAHSETVSALKDEIADYKDDAEKLPNVQKELDKLKKEAEEAEKKGEKDPYKVKYDAIKEEFENYKKDISAKETKANKEKFYSELLKEAGVSEKRIAAILKVTDLDKMEIGDDGKLKDAKDLTKAIKEEWADFITTTKETGAQTATPPSGGSGKAMTKDEIMKIKDAGERQKAIAENHELFGY